MPGQLSNLPILICCYQTYAIFHELLITFPKTQRYSLGTNCQTEILNLIKQILRAGLATVSSEKIRHLQEASVSLDTTKILISLCKDCRCISNQTYQHFESRLSEIGKMLGGWLKSLPK